MCEIIIVLTKIPFLQFDEKIGVKNNQHKFLMGFIQNNIFYCVQIYKY